MKMRPPSVPLITVDPYFSVWSPADRLYDKTTEHWAGSPNTLIGTVSIDGKEFRFMGENDLPVIKQVYFDMTALTTHYTFMNDEISLNVKFFTPLFADDLYRLSRPVSYMNIDYSSNDEKEHDVKVKIAASEEFCMDKKGDKETDVEILSNGSLAIGKIGTKEQNILCRSGDDLRIEWGYFYLACKNCGKVFSENIDGMTFLCAELSLENNKTQTVLFSYDDIYSLNYFGEKVKAYWKTKNGDILNAINEAYGETEEMYKKSLDFSLELETKATLAGGEKYADLLALAYRQTFAAHKLAVDSEGNILFISKECFSNGCAATVDVTYPSSPVCLLYNTELLKGMLRPIFKFSVSDEWKFDFAPHDVGQYPLLLGQVYGKNHEAEGKYLDYQMPVEECGNMLIMMANISLIDNNTEFFDKYEDILASWVKYLIKYGNDPENQLCTDDFAGHLAHNCNLSLKAIMGIAGYALVLKMKGKTEESEKFMGIAKEMADSWVNRASNPDGSFRLAFDKPGTFSMKYNMIWDKLWHTNLFAPSVYYSEFSSNKKRIHAYGMPLDNRADYTKSDWLLWTACFSPEKEEFEEFISPMWNAYNVSHSRVPMSDWYDTVTSEHYSFRHRTVQGGLFLKLLF